MSNSWRLAIDFGTSNSAAAHQVGGQEPQTLPLTHQGNLMPSAVFFTESEAFAGHAAINHASSRPDAYLATPKRAIDHQSVRLGGKDIPTATVFAAVIRQILEKAKAQHNGVDPEAVVLTHPEAWSSAALQTLIEAARQSGIPTEKLSLISEPRAAAYHYSAKNNLKAGEKVAVFDFGGGTLDVAVLSPAGDGTLQVVAARGDNSLGGRNIDSIIKQWVLDQLDENNTPFHDFLLSPDAAAATHNLDLAVRSAKEVLSDAPSATITVSGGGYSENLLLTRQEFEHLIGSDIARAMDLTRATLLDAGLRPDQSTLVYLTGGSARIPYIQDQLGNLAHVATLDDPKTVVCRGALMGPTRPAAAILDGSLSQYINPGASHRDSFRGQGGAGAAGFVGGAAAGAGSPQPVTEPQQMPSSAMGGQPPQGVPAGYPGAQSPNGFPNGDQQQTYAMGNVAGGNFGQAGSGKKSGMPTGAKVAIAVGVVVALGASAFGISQLSGRSDKGTTESSTAAASGESSDTASEGTHSKPTTAANTSPLQDETLKLPRSDDLTEDVAKLLPAAFANTLDCYQGDTKYKYFPADSKQESFDVAEGFMCRVKNEDLNQVFDVTSPSLYVYHDAKAVEAALADLGKKNDLKYYKFTEYSNSGNIVAWGQRFDFSDGKTDDVELLVANKEKNILIRTTSEFNDDQDDNAKEFADHSGLTSKPWGK